MTYFAYVTCSEGRPHSLLYFSYKAMHGYINEDLMYLGKFKGYQEMIAFYHSRTVLDKSGTLQWLPEDTINTGHGFTVRKIPIS